MPAVERTYKFTYHIRSHVDMGRWQDVRGIKFAAFDIGLMIAARLMISIAAYVMATPTNRMRRFTPQYFQRVGMNYGWHRQNEHQHYDSYIPYVHAKYFHDHMNSRYAFTFL